MDDPTSTDPTTATQLTQVRIPLDDAAVAFSMRDSTGRIPIVVVPERLSRINVGLVVMGILLIAAALLALVFLEGTVASNPIFLTVLMLLALACIVIGLYQSFIVRVPEGVNALLARAGRYTKTINPGTHIVLPWIRVTHLVTRREIPFDVPVVEALTADHVRANVDSLVTFAITDPYRFVYNISADDFDHVFQALCQGEMRALLRSVTIDQVLDLVRQDMVTAQANLSARVKHYGVEVAHLAITSAQPPLEFIRSEETRQLAIVQREELTEQQALARQRQASEEALAQQMIQARGVREAEVLRLQAQQAELRQHVVEMEAQAEATRLARLEERLKQYPLAAKWEWESQQLEVARALAGNAHAMLQVGDMSDVVGALMLRDTLATPRIETTDTSDHRPIELPRSSQ